MYIDKLRLENFRTFQETKIDFCHPDQDFSAIGIPAPRLRNINLLLGDNGSGKTTLLKAVAMAALGPAVSDANLPIYRLIRRSPTLTRKGSPSRRSSSSNSQRLAEAILEADFTVHPQDGQGSRGIPAKMESKARISQKGDIERVAWEHREEKKWSPIFSSESEAFFFVGYGATRRVESQERVDLGARQVTSLLRAQRIRSLFEEAYSLIPFPLWLPQLEKGNPGRFTQVKTLINRLLDGTGYSFTGERDPVEYVFEKGGLKVPFPALSDGYRAYLGWIGDLLYHVCNTTPRGKRLIENKGIVMVDEIDLHLHPKWQMTVLPMLARALPNIQFIVTSHSPLIVGSLEWMNILLIKPDQHQTSVAERIKWAVHGLDADQVLLTEFFGMESTRSEGKKRELKTLSLQARSGSPTAAKRLLEQMSRGLEEK
jgi:predicted ATP-binding protein involved in virulence